MKETSMEGIRFVTDENGEKVAVQLDLNRYRDIWEDIFDQILVEKRKGEKRESFDAVEKRLVKAGKLRA
jgi:hypothetical protein